MRSLLHNFLLSIALVVLCAAPMLASSRATAVDSLIQTRDGKYHQLRDFSQSLQGDKKIELARYVIAMRASVFAAIKKTGDRPSTSFTLEVDSNSSKRLTGKFKNEGGVAEAISLPAKPNWLEFSKFVLVVEREAQASPTIPETEQWIVREAGYGESGWTALCEKKSEPALRAWVELAAGGKIVDTWGLCRLPEEISPGALVRILGSQTIATDPPHMSAYVIEIESNPN